MVNQYTAARGVVFFLRSQARLLCTAAFLAMAVAWAKAPVWALLLGFSMSLAGIVLSVLVFRRGAERARGLSRSPS